VLQALGRLEEALRELEAVRDAAPKEASVHLMMGNICKTLGFRDRAYRDRAMHHFVTALDLEPKDAATVRAAIDQLDDGGAAGEDETQRIVGDVDAMLT
jgi:anaphase-promoting complex subunit 3